MPGVSRTGDASLPGMKAYVVIGAGIFLILAGVALTAVQLLRGTLQESSGRAMTASAWKINLSLKTTFPGLILVAFGVLLTAIGAFTG